jgi:hypothetical protein
MLCYTHTAYIVTSIIHANAEQELSWITFQWLQEKNYCFLFGTEISLVLAAAQDIYAKANNTSKRFNWHMMFLLLYIARPICLIN